ncbi:MAG: T9SS type A sorting domain-containing protein [Adhaeribacter sp.]
MLITWQLDLSFLPAGAYLLKLQGSNLEGTRRVVKQ